MSSSNENSFSLELGKVHTILQIVKETKGFGKTKVIFYPPYRIKNALPIDMMIQFISSSLVSEAKENSSKIQPQQELHEYRVGLQKTKLQFKIKLPGFWWSEESRLYSPNTEFAREVTLKDMNGRSHTISIHHIESFDGPKQFIFYTKGYLLNESTYKLFFHSLDEKKNTQLLAGYGRVEQFEEKNEELVFFHEQKKILVSEQEKISKPENVSKPFSLETIGDSAIELQTQQGYLHLGVTAKTICVDDDNHIYTKVMSFTPRYVVENKLKNKIGIRQAGTDQNFHIIPEDREPYKWQDQAKPKKIQYTIFDEPHSWDWSGEIDITALGLANFLLRSIVNPKVYKYMKADILNDNGLIFIVIDEYIHGNEPYIISNELPDTRISYIQEGDTKHNLFELLPGEKAPFIWDHPSDKKSVKVQFTNLNAKYENYHSNFTIDKIDSKVKFSLNPTVINQPKLDAVAQTSIEGNSKVLIFKKSLKSEKKKKEGKEAKEGEGKLLNIEFKANLKLEHLGINLIENTGKKTIEMLYITFLGLELVVIDTNKKRTLQSKIQYFNIDNNHAYLVNYPVLFTPTFKKKCLEKQFFLNFFMEKSLKELEVNVFNSLVLDLEPMTIKVEDSLISVIIEFYSALSEILYPKDQEQTTDDTNQRYIYHLNKNKRPLLWFWEKDPIQASNKLTFIDNFVISPIKLNLTFMSKSKGSELESGFAILAMFFKAIGVALANIDDAPIKLNGLKLDNVFDTNSGITSKLISHYKQSVTTEVFKLLGSINIIGNPVGLFTQIGTGVSDLFEKPKEGFVKGPLEGGLGVVEGAGSLIKHAFAGTFNSIDKMTGSLGTGLAALSLDEEYLKEREKMKMKKAAHVGEGFKQGAMSIFTGFEKGITGVFMKPIEGAKSGGVKGFFKGTLQGITGLVFKPVSGVLDATSKAAEGIKNTATTFDDKPNEKRMRLIRSFYGSEKYYKSYNTLDAYLNYLLKVELKNGRYADANYLNGYLYKTNNETSYLFLTLEYIIKFNETKRKKEWDILSENIKDFEIKGNDVLIYANAKPKKWLKEFVTVKLPADEKMDVFYNYLKEIKEKGKEEKI